MSTESETVIDLCDDSESDDTEDVEYGDDETQNPSENNHDEIEQQEPDAFNFADTIASSSIVIEDEELGHIVLSDYAAHIYGNEHMKGPKIAIQKEKTNMIDNECPRQRIRVRSDLCSAASPSSLTEPGAKYRIKFKRKISSKHCDSTSETQTTPATTEKRTRSLAESLKDALQAPRQAETPDTTIQSNATTVQAPAAAAAPAISAITPSPMVPILHVSNVMGLLSCVERYAIWQRNSEACALLDQLRTSLQGSDRDNEASTKH